MVFGPEHNPELRPVDRCLMAIASFTHQYGKAMVFDMERRIFRPADKTEATDALVQLGQVDIQDLAQVDYDVPIIYEVAVYSPEGLAKSGVVASLLQGLEPLGKSVRYDFTPDKTVTRQVVTATELGELEELHEIEAWLLAEQLDGLGPLDMPLY